LSPNQQYYTTEAVTPTASHPFLIQQLREGVSFSLCQLSDASIQHELAIVKVKHKHSHTHKAALS